MTVKRGNGQLKRLQTTNKVKLGHIWLENSWEWSEKLFFRH